MLTAPEQVASGLDVQPCLAALRFRQTWGWLPGMTHDWNRMQTEVSLDDPPVAALLTPLLPAPVVRPIQAKILYPFGVLPPHSDAGRIALHVVLMTNEGATFTVRGHEWHLPEGTAWMIPTSQIHTAVNNGRTPRIHLVAEWNI